MTTIVFHQSYLTLTISDAKDQLFSHSPVSTRGLVGPVLSPRWAWYVSLVGTIALHSDFSLFLHEVSNITFFSLSTGTARLVGISLGHMLKLLILTLKDMGACFWEFNETRH